MSTLRLVSIVALVLAAASARADVPDPTLAAVKDRAAVLRLDNNTELRATPIGFDDQTVTLVEEGTGRVLTIARAQLTMVILQSAMPSPPAPAPKVRHIGLQLSTGPGNLLVDFEYGRFYGFVGTSIGYPVIFNNDSNGNKQYVGAIVGAGATWRLSPRSNWSFDLMGTLTPTWWGGFSMGIGVAAGFHYTSPTGFTVGFKIPILGVAPGCNSVLGEETLDYSTGIDSGGCRQVKGGPSLVGNYYLQAGMSLPIISVGYRF